MDVPMPKDELQRSLVTRSFLVNALRQVGLERGDVVCAHIGIKRLGYVCGTAQSVIDALLEVLGSDGTLMMPSFSGENSDPATWRFPPVPLEWIKPIRDETPPYDIHSTPTRQMGTVAELFRHRPGAVRSDHPHSSFVAIGAKAKILTAEHGLNFRFGPNSPLGRLAALAGKVLLLGVDDNRASFVYLAQYCAGLGKIVTKSAAVLASEKVVWQEYKDFEVSNSLVDAGVKRLLAEGFARTATIGDGTAILFNAREALIDLVSWFSNKNDVERIFPRASTPLPVDWADWLGKEAVRERNRHEGL